MNHKSLILSLIKDDVIHLRLLNCLNDLGLDTGNYFLSHSETIFWLLVIKENQMYELYEIYLELTKVATHLDFSEPHISFDKLAKDIYNDLAFKSFKDCNLTLKMLNGAELIICKLEQHLQAKFRTHLKCQM